MRGMWRYYSEKYESLKGFLTPRALHKHRRRKCTHGKVQVRKTWPETQQTTFTRKLNLTPSSAAPCSRVCHIRRLFQGKYLAELPLINSPSVKPPPPASTTHSLIPLCVEQGHLNIFINIF